MALSRIWSAFIIVSIVVAAIKWIGWNDTDVFNRMVVGKADDSYGYYIIGDPATAGISRDSFVKKMNAVSFSQNDKATTSKYLFANDLSSDSIRILKNQNSGLILMTFGQAL